MIGFTLIEPKAHLVRSQQWRGFVDSPERPPQELVGSRVAFRGGRLSLLHLGSLGRRGYEFPAPPKGSEETGGYWRRRKGEKAGRFVERGPVREWVPDPQYGLSEPVSVWLPESQWSGHARVEGFVRWSGGKPVGQYRPGTEARFRRPAGAQGPYTWILRDWQMGEVSVDEWRELL